MNSRLALFLLLAGLFAGVGVSAGDEVVINPVDAQKAAEAVAADFATAWRKALADKLQPAALRQILRKHVDSTSDANTLRQMAETAYAPPLNAKPTATLIYKKAIRNAKSVASLLLLIDSIDKTVKDRFLHDKCLERCLRLSRKECLHAGQIRQIIESVPATPATQEVFPDLIDYAERRSRLQEDIIIVAEMATNLLNDKQRARKLYRQACDRCTEVEQAEDIAQSVAKTLGDAEWATNIRKSAKEAVDERQALIDKLKTEIIKAYPDAAESDLTVLNHWQLNHILKLHQLKSIDVLLKDTESVETIPDLNLEITYCDVVGVKIINAKTAELKVGPKFLFAWARNTSPTQNASGISFNFDKTSLKDVLNLLNIDLKAGFTDQQKESIQIHCRTENNLDKKQVSAFINAYLKRRRADGKEKPAMNNIIPDNWHKTIGPQFLVFDHSDYKEVSSEVDVVCGLGGRWLTIPFRLKNNLVIDRNKFIESIKKSFITYGWVEESVIFKGDKYVLSKMYEKSDDDIGFSHGPFYKGDKIMSYNVVIHLSKDCGRLVLYCSAGW